MPQFDSSAFWGMVGIVVGIIVATVFFLLGKKKTLLQYYISITPLITEKMAGILNDRMLIDGQPVKSMFSTTISFINSGNQRIKFSDFSEQEPLRIILNGHLYGHDISRGNQKLLPKVVPVKDNVLNISFENLKPRQFFKVIILHDGPLDVLGELTTGTMRAYSPSLILMILGMISGFGCVLLLFDSSLNGPVFALIGSLLELLLCGILFFLYCSFMLVDMLKDARARKLFMR